MEHPCQLHQSHVGEILRTSAEILPHRPVHLLQPEFMLEISILLRVSLLHPFEQPCLPREHSFQLKQLRPVMPRLCQVNICGPSLKRLSVDTKAKVVRKSLKISLLPRLPVPFQAQQYCLSVCKAAIQL